MNEDKQTLKKKIIGIFSELNENYPVQHQSDCPFKPKSSIDYFTVEVHQSLKTEGSGNYSFL
jgi:hypothetical protein